LTVDESRAADHRRRPPYTCPMRLEKWQRNAIFQAVVAGGLDARECTFDYDGEGSRITHLPSASYFFLAGDPGHYTATAVVGESPPRPSESFTWAKVDERVQRWSEEVKRDVDTPDLWAELQREGEILTGARYEDLHSPRTLEQVVRVMQASFLQLLQIDLSGWNVAVVRGRSGRQTSARACRQTPSRACREAATWPCGQSTSGARRQTSAGTRRQTSARTARHAATWSRRHSSTRTCRHPTARSSRHPSSRTGG
jgi:hypothetical protein